MALPFHVGMAQLQVFAMPSEAGIYCTGLNVFKLSVFVSNFQV
jgi:hypothetical protein